MKRPLVTTPVITGGRVERFWAKVDRRGPDECWPWIGSKQRNGYGTFQVGSRGRRTVAHRVAMALAMGAPVDGAAVVCHHCDNPPCCNPAHLYVGTMADNARDRDSRGRTGRPPRATNPHVTLTPEQVEAMRLLHRDEFVPVHRLAAQYSVAIATVKMALSGRTWPDVPGPIKGRDYSRVRRVHRGPHATTVRGK